MGCGGSKVDDLPLVIRCRERKELIKAAVDHRYSLAASHVTYFRSLKDVGDALRRFVDEELVIGGGLNSPPSSPVLTLPSDEGKKKKKNNNNNNNKSSSSSTSLTHSASLSHHHSPEDNGSHLHFDTSSDSISSDHIHDSPDKPEPEPEAEPYYYYSSSQPEMNSYSYSYYMKRSSTEIPSMVYEEPPPHSSNFYPGYPYYGGMGGGYVGAPMGSDSSPQNPYYEPFRDPYYFNQPQINNPTRSPPPPPPAPQVSSWDFLNPFDSIENVYPSYYPRTRYGVGSTSTSSPDSVEVRRREGIPDLEDETKQEPIKESHKQKQKLVEQKPRQVSDSGEGKSRAVPGFGEGTSRAVPSQNDETKNSVEENEIKSSPETIIVSESSTGEEEIARKKSVSFEVDVQSSTQDDNGSSKPSSFTTVSTHVTRDLEEVVKEIRDEFEAASGFGKEVAVMLEVGKLPYQSTSTVLKVISSRILNLVAPSMLTHSHQQSRRSRPAAASIMKMAKAKYGESEEFRMKSGNLSSTLERLYAWEKKLYKEVKDEERLRIVYEKKCKRLKVLDDRGAESNKIDATQASIRKLLTKINITITAIDAISSRIQKLRDEELQPQITELIHGLIRMWKNMLKCHQKQFQAIIESKSRTLMARTGAGRDSSLRATVELQVELLNWSSHFSDWIITQKYYIESLNGWLLRCLLEEPEETPDGVMPFSPGRIGAPPIFVICNDWYQAMERLSESEVANTMNAFALSLHQLWERQDEEQRQRLKAEYLSKDFEKRLKTLRKKEIKTGNDLDKLSDKSVVPTESGVSPLDDLKVDLDSMRKRLEDEKARYKETVKQVHEAASTSLQSGLIPIFETLGNFTSKTLKAYEHVRIQNTGEPT
ncbi:protein of unknown function DUF632 [Macleaya cordata]|uniref:DUF632 domain-containing protein n=1 Tax=Macleaya cordata TaxID=56857 RepID=A0A200QBR9_MACCD|nr:protein of unknown function DUF632 [Macleaya cordata]